MLPARAEGIESRSAGGSEIRMKRESIRGGRMLSKLRTHLCALLRRSEVERELDEELRYHIEQQVEQNIRLGMNPEEAQQAAVKSFGGGEQAKERSRDARGVAWLGGSWKQLRCGARR